MLILWHIFGSICKNIIIKYQLKKAKKKKKINKIQLQKDSDPIVVLSKAMSILLLRL